MQHQHNPISQAFAPRSTAYGQGKYGRMFAFLSPQAPDTDEMRTKMKLLAEHCKGSNPDSNSGRPAGYTYLGQFISHDLTFDPTSINERQTDPEQLSNFRTPALDLDSIYGGGPFVNPYFYQLDNDGHRTRFLLFELDGSLQDPNQAKQFYDVPRLPSGVAVIADPRNDENLFVSQLHVAFLLLHNYFETQVPSTFEGHARFLEARKLLQWHYQYLILHDYLNVVLDPDIVKNVMPGKQKHHGYPNLKYFDWRNEPFVPLEFSGAVFRFGHSQVRGIYQTNSGHGPDINVFDKKEGSPPQTYLKWIDFFNTYPLNEYFLIDQKIAPDLFKVPGLPGISEINLPYQNLVRGLKLELPSGQSVAYAMGLKNQVINRKKMKEANRLGKFTEYAAIESKHEINEFLDNTPLWYYILLEARLSGGQHLGPVGSQIVAEVIIGLIQRDKSSYLNHDPLWTPEKIKNDPNETFKMADLLEMAGIYEGALVPSNSQTP